MNMANNETNQGNKTDNTIKQKWTIHANQTWTHNETTQWTNTNETIIVSGCCLCFIDCFFKTHKQPWNTRMQQCHKQKHKHNTLSKHKTQQDNTQTKTNKTQHTHKHKRTQTEQ